MKLFKLIRPALLAKALAVVVKHNKPLDHIPGVNPRQPTTSSGEDLASQIKKDIAANVTSALQERLNNDNGILDSRWGYKGSSQPAFPETTVKMPYGVSVEAMSSGIQRSLEIVNKHADAPQTRKMIMVDNELRGQIEDAIFKLSCAQENALDASVFTRVSLPRTHADKIMDLLQELQVKAGDYE